VELVVSEPLDLEASLLGGQAHRWKREGDWYSGVLRGNLVLLRQRASVLDLKSAPASPETLVQDIRKYLRLDDHLEDIYADITQDANVASQVQLYPGLRVLRQEPWECLVAYICSANSNIETIHLNMERLSDTFGHAVALNGHRRNTFPMPIDLAEAGEMELRKLKLGFRAPYVHRAAVAVVERRLDLDHLVNAPYEEAKVELMALRGIGDKIADCIALMSLEKMQAFPIDVWVRRALADWYFPSQKTPTNRVLLQWAQDYFGRYAGYANQYLFHGRRLRDKKSTTPAVC
jgi:N-glycosylase/DNA lyase